MEKRENARGNINLAAMARMASNTYELAKTYKIHMMLSIHYPLLHEKQYFCQL